MPFPNAPTPLSYGAPQVDFSPLGELGNQYFKSAEDRRKYDLARAFQGGIPQNPDGTPDIAAMTQTLARYGHIDLPLMQEQQERAALQNSPSPDAGGPGGMPQYPSSGPRVTSAPPAGSQTPSASTGPAAPFMGKGSNEGSLNRGAEQGESLQTLSTGVLRGRNVDIRDIIPRIETSFGIKAGDPLTPDQEKKIRPVLESAIAARAGGQGQPQPQPQPQSQQQAQIQSQAPTALVPPGTDPRYEIAKLRLAGQMILKSSPGQGRLLAQQYFDRADKMESRMYGETAQTQNNANRAFEELQRTHIATEMTPVKIGTGTFGEDIYGVKDPVSGEFKLVDPKTGKVGGVVSGARESAIPEKDLELDRKAGRNVEYLQSLDPERQGITRKIVNYEIDPRTLSIKGGHREMALAAAARFDPSYDQKNYAAFSEGLKRFGASKQGDGVKAFNVGIEHIDQLVELGHALNNGDYPKINELTNWFKANVGEDAPTNFNGLKAIVGAEIVKAIAGAGGTGEERATAARTVSAASSMRQLDGIASTYKNAMGAQLGGLQRQYEQSTGRKDFDRLLSPQAIRARDSHNNAPNAARNDATASPGTAMIVNPKTGDKMMLSPDGTKWVPVPK